MEKQKFKRVHLIVLDSVGIGESPDAHLFGDEGADTLGHIGEAMRGLNMPNMGKLGLSNISEIQGLQWKRTHKRFMAKCRKRLSEKIR